MAIAAALGLLVAPGPAAAKKCVRPAGGGGCFPSIQAAIDAASAGETIVIRPGHYRERILVDERVLLLGGGRQPGQVVIDGEQDGTAVVTISASGVKLRNLTVWNSSGSLVDIAGGATGATLSKVILRQSGGACLTSAAAGTAVLGSSLRTCGNGGIAVGADGFLLRDSSVLVAAGTCVQVTGADARIVDNLLRACDDYGINLDGPGGSSALVSGNRVLHVTYEGIYVRSPNATVRGNRVDGTTDYGIEVDSTHPVVSRNTVFNTKLGAFYLGCFTGCSGGEVAGNRALWSEGNGFQLSFSGTASVHDNLARGMGGDGFDIQDPGPYQIRANAVQDASGVGFRFEASVAGATVVGNRSSSTYGSGFLVGGDNVTLRRNRANLGYMGFTVALGAAAVTLENNTATLDTYPFCDQTAAATLGAGNNFSASACPP